MKFEPWHYMCLLASGMYFFCKWISFAYYPQASAVRFPALYLFGWVGMDPSPFKARQQKKDNSQKKVLLSALANLAFGLLIFRISLYLPSQLWLLQAWLICIGIVMVLHFGSFKALAWLLRCNGFTVEAIMKCPLAAKTAGEFWGGRWNLAFNQLVYPFIFSPCRKRFGPKCAVLCTFFLSGLIHELVISLPAAAGWGLPTVYFLIQGLTMLFEKSGLYQKMNSFFQRVLSLSLIALPAIILFHPPFMKNIIIPFAHAVGII